MKYSAIVIISFLAAVVLGPFVSIWALELTGSKVVGYAVAPLWGMACGYSLVLLRPFLKKSDNNPI